MQSDSDIVLTFDIDWAPDWAIDHVASKLVEHQIKATWFVTHASKASSRLAEHVGLFELGIHPNLLPGSTHGGTEDEVMAHVRELVPDAITMRTHGRYQSSNFLSKANLQYGIEIDVSLLLPRASHLATFVSKHGGSRLHRVPYWWEDDDEMFENDPNWHITHSEFETPGLKVFDFHPIHIVLNTDRFESYTKVKELGDVQQLTPETASFYRNTGSGPGSLFSELLERLAGKGKRIMDLVDLRSSE